MDTPSKTLRFYYKHALKKCSNNPPPEKKFDLRQTNLNPLPRKNYLDNPLQYLEFSMKDFLKSKIDKYFYHLNCVLFGISLNLLDEAFAEYVLKFYWNFPLFLAQFFVKHRV